MNISLLKELLAIPSVSGDEFSFQKKVMKYLKSNNLDVKTDNIGNVYTRINPEAKFQIMIEAHSDEIGFMVRKIDESGYIYLEKVGGIDPKAAVGMKVQIGQNKIKGVVGSLPSQGEITTHTLYIDCGFGSSRLALDHIKVGDYVSYDTTPEELFGRKLASRALDNKTGVFMLVEIMKKLQNSNLDIGVTGVTTVNEETNTGGAYFAASKVKPDMCIVLDVTYTGDHPASDDLDVYLGGGPVLATGAPIHPKIQTHFEEVAYNLGMPIQYEITPRNTGTSGDEIRKTGNGVPITLISLPLRYMHSPFEVCDLRDMEQIIDLIVNGIEEIKDNFNLCPLS